MENLPQKKWKPPKNTLVGDFKKTFLAVFGVWIFRANPVLNRLFSVYGMDYVDLW